jgi:hypothetical protein
LKKLVSAALAAAILAGSAAAYAATDDAPAPADARMQTQAVLLDAHLAGLKAGLKLTAEQEKNWQAFESAIRDIAKQRIERFRALREQREKDERPTPVDHLRRMSERLASGSADLKTLADAAAPLYASLDDGQKRNFGPLFQDLVRQGRRDALRWREHRRHERDGDADGDAK